MNQVDVAKYVSERCKENKIPVTQAVDWFKALYMLDNKEDVEYFLNVLLEDYNESN